MISEIPMIFDCENTIEAQTNGSKLAIGRTNLLGYDFHI
jgi:hypothetical protein